jgi:hypothetical protein
MRFSTLASLSFLTVLASAQTSTTDVSTSNDLLAEFAKLPTCVVRMTIVGLFHCTQLTPTLDQVHNRIPHPAFEMYSW